MGKEAKQLQGLFQDIIQYIRLNHTDSIDNAYTYFWDKENPDEFLSGTSLSLGFHNFEDWLVFDYKANEAGESFIDLYIKQKQDLDQETIGLLGRAKASVLSLYEVVSVSKDKRVHLRDLLLEEEIELKEKSLTRGLNKGDIFATRIMKLDKMDRMGSCVYPFVQSQKKQVLAYVSRQFGRYIRNVKPDGAMRDYLKDYGDVFNIVWMNFFNKRTEEKG
jgi:hypothetical protein